MTHPIRPKQLEKLDNHTTFLPSGDAQGYDLSAVLFNVRHALNEEFSGLDVLKAARQRLVVRLPINDGAVILKLFPLSNLASRLRYKKYALREFGNYQIARQRGILTPICLGYIERRKLGLVNLSGVILEDLNGYQDALQISQSLGYLAAAKRCSIPLCRLFETGVTHIDARDENIMFKDSEYRLIDWQYTSFTTPRADWLLEHLAAYFIRKGPAEDRQTLLTDWIPHLHDAARHPTDLPDFTQRVEALLAKRQGTRARLALHPA